MLKKFTVGAALATLLATGAIAQSTPPEPTAPQATAPAPATTDATAKTTTTQTTTTTANIDFKSSMGSTEQLVSKVTGMAVRNSAGENLGDINDLVMDESGKASIAIIGVGGFLGLGEKDVGVPFASLAFADAQDGTRVARLDVTKDALKNAPNFVYRDSKTTASTKQVPSQ